MMKVTEIPLRDFPANPTSHVSSFLYPYKWSESPEDLDQFGRPFQAPTRAERHLNDNIPDFLEIQDPHKKHAAGPSGEKTNAKEDGVDVAAGGKGKGEKSPKDNGPDDDDDEDKPVWELLVDAIKSEKITLTVFFITLTLLLLLRYQTSWKDLSHDAWYTIWTLYIAIVILVRGITDPDIALFGCSTLLLYREIITPAQSFKGLGNDSVLTIALMLTIAAGIEESGAIEFISKFCLGRPWTVRTSQLRLMFMNVSLSAWTNNIPLVAVFIPVVEAWCQRYNLPPSKFMIPLSFATILGGLVTIIGTSTNLVVKALASVEYPDMKLGFFEIGAVGAPMAVAGILYLALVSPYLLPNRKGIRATMSEDSRRYTIRVIVRTGSDLVGHSVERNSLRHLPALFLVDIERRSGEVISAPSGDVIIEAGDKLCFTGAVEGARYLWKSTDFVPSFDGSIGIDGHRILVEAVVNVRSPLIGKTVRTSRFRSEYGAAILSIHRGGERLEGKVGDLILRAGDTLLVEAPPTFVDEHKHNPVFALVAGVAGGMTTTGARWKMYVAPLLMLTLVVLNAQTAIEIQLSNTALACVFAYFALGIFGTVEAKNRVPACTLLTIAGGDGIATALTVTGVADKLAGNLVTGFNGLGPIGGMYGVYLGTVILTALLSNGASATLMFPIAVKTALLTGINPKAYIYTIALAASADFSTPIGYQTNLMVSGPGGYKFFDYPKIGLPLQVLCCLISVPLAHKIFLILSLICFLPSFCLSHSPSTSVNYSPKTIIILSRKPAIPAEFFFLSLVVVLLCGH